MNDLRDRSFTRSRALLLSFGVFAIGVVLVRFAFGSGEPAVAEHAAEPPVIDSPILARADFTVCTDCHGDLDRKVRAGRPDGLKYWHESHFELGVSECSVCHAANTHEPDVTNLPSMERCFTCHGLTEYAIADGTCEACHPADFPAEPPSHLVVAWGQRPHADAALEDRFACLMCHEETSFCAECHGMPMPHGEGWEERPHAEVTYELGMAACVDCHPTAGEVDPRSSCDSCHHPEGDEATFWRTAHPPLVREEGGAACFQCHEPPTCAGCHLRGETDFAEDRREYLDRAPPEREEEADDTEPRVPAAQLSAPEPIRS